MANYKHKKIFENDDFGIISIDIEDKTLGYNFLAIIKNKNFNQYNKIVEELNKIKKEIEKYQYNEVIVDNLLFNKEKERYHMIYFIEENNEIKYHNIVMRLEEVSYRDEFIDILKETTRYYLNNISQLNN